jgi:hypothetical protein
MIRSRTWTILLAALLACGAAGCGDGGDDASDAEDTSDAADADADVGADADADSDAEAESSDEAEAEAEASEPGPCDGLTDTNCIQIQLGEAMHYRRLDTYDTQEIDDDGTLRTVVFLPDLIDSWVTTTPEEYRYQMFGTDGYTFGGYATWTNMLNGYIELTVRRIYWDPSQLLPNSWNVRDSYLIVLTPAGG